jgi:DNA-binding XRE family transcriptional regulator
MIAQSSIGAWEVGKNEPTIFSAILLADYFDVTLDELCCRKRGNK